MNTEIINVGTELLLGDILNTNVQTLSKVLKELGINCYYQTVVGDNAKRIEAVTRLALSRSDCIIFNGGLGPTYDDITRDIIAKALDVELEFNQESLQRIQNYFMNRNRQMSDNNLRQAMYPKGSIIFENSVGTADGFAVSHNDKLVIALPGPPHEMNAMVNEHLIPYLSQFSKETLVSDTIYLWGIGESDAEAQVHDLMLSQVNPTIAPYAGIDGVSIRVTSLASDKETGHKLNEPFIDTLSELFSDTMYSLNIPSLEETLVMLLNKHYSNLHVHDELLHGEINYRMSQVLDNEVQISGSINTYENDIKNDCEIKITEEDNQVCISVFYHGQVRKKTLPKEVLKVTRSRRQRQLANEAMMMLVQLINLQ
ncbi:CinA family nicotinamide mononucleotide deamidase-related protein [Erysipelothrix sp. HDW6A]|uniref:CinA family nicotinamide mononucleotide deamidase-related protein n=1 Tax=Erysipelothrix sp. HDW6A TaxID=2714928 RepID=UPI00140C635A|nr:CinA family nicotinamide mononucleotide deamidase-related protein [Erysipelothrix sp. HDW6A]QIK57535.1 CinA family nicotinamide mononucleotide deamidase-related protein [Erysipelothrix sp. HDW6A]